MRDYRCYHIDTAGHITGVETFEVPGDSDACDRARLIVMNLQWRAPRAVAERLRAAGFEEVEAATSAETDCILRTTLVDTARGSGSWSPIFRLKGRVRGKNRWKHH